MSIIKNKLVENFSLLAVMQLLNYILPFLTLPFLVRILGIESYGAFVFSQAFIAYFVIIVDFGFDLYATRLISINRNDREKINEIVNIVLICKTLLFAASFTVLIIICTCIPFFNEYIYLHLINFSMIIGLILFSNFFYQGLENMKYITLLNAGAKIFFTIMIFVWIDNEKDLELTAFLNSSGYIILGIISSYIMVTKYKWRFKIVPLHKIIIMFKDSAQFFWSRISVSIYTVSNTVVIGLFLGNAAVGLFGAAEKIFRAVTSLYAPLNTVFYPYMAHKRDVKLYLKVIKIACLINIFAAFILFLLSDFIINLLYGAEFDQASTLLIIFSIVLIYNLPSILIGYPLLGALGHSKVVNMSVVYAAIFHLFVLVCFIPILNIQIVAILIGVTELIVLVIRIYYVRKFNLLKID